MAQMGHEAQLGVQTLNLDKDIIEGVTTEEELQQILPEISPDDIIENDIVQTVEDNIENVVTNIMNTSLNNNELDEVEFVLENEDQTDNNLEVTEEAVSTAVIVTEVSESSDIVFTDVVPDDSVQLDNCTGCKKPFSPATVHAAKT